MRLAFASTLGALLLSCAPEIPEGILACRADVAGASCPGGWYCHSDMRCYKRPELTRGPIDHAMEVDAATNDAESQDATGTRDGASEAHAGDAGPDIPMAAIDGAGPSSDDASGPVEPAEAGVADGSSGAPIDASPLPEASVPPSCASADSGFVCDDLNFCNGVESCTPGASEADARGCVPGTAVSCPTGHACSEQLDACTPCRDGLLDDSDGDGFESLECGGQDCDDKDPSRLPGGRELCDGKDNDCDGVVDGARSDMICASSAPAGGVSSCSAGSCAPRCSDPDYDLQAGVCTRHDDCAGMTRCGTGSCNDGVRSYTCTCLAGYLGSGTGQCVDIDECATGMHQCDTSPLASCTNTTGSYQCTCPEGTTGTGLGADGCRAIECSTWVGAAASGAIPLGAPAYGRVTITNSGVHSQYICRLAVPDGTFIPGKANGTPNNGAFFEWGCFGAVFDGSAWLEYNADDVGQRFEVFVPPPSCRLDWVAVPAGGPLPANALRMSVDASGAPLYSCLAAVNDGHAQGANLGRVGGAPGSPCIIQYFGSVLVRSSEFSVLVRL